MSMSPGSTGVVPVSSTCNQRFPNNTCPLRSISAVFAAPTSSDVQLKAVISKRVSTVSTLTELDGEFLSLVPVKFESAIFNSYNISYSFSYHPSKSANTSALGAAAEVIARNSMSYPAETGSGSRCFSCELFALAAMVSPNDSKIVQPGWRIYTVPETLILATSFRLYLQT